MRRRELILGAAGLAAVGQSAFAADDLTAVARDAYLFALPLIETAAQRAGVPP
ncbi:MAG: hypothetical protein JWM33_2099, partial [Caulobacteraceae bacterium]|nr:hypothetical protein [Caulobacteraceae bacterium]